MNEKTSDEFVQFFSSLARRFFSLITSYLVMSIVEFRTEVKTMPISINIIFLHLLIVVSIDWTHVDPHRFPRRNHSPFSIQFKHSNSGGDARSVTNDDFPPYDCAMPFVPTPALDPPDNLIETPSKVEHAMSTSTFKTPVVHPIRPPRTEPLPDGVAMETQIPSPIITESTTETVHAVQSKSTPPIIDNNTKNSSEF